MKLILLFLVLAGTTFALVADDGSARRFAFAQNDPVVCKYFLTATSQVQQRLNLTRHQIETLKAAMLASPKSIPAVAEFRRSQAKLLDKADSNEERQRIRREGNKQVSILIHQHWNAVLRNTLSAVQENKLDELLLQMRGPRMIVESTNVSARLHLSKDKISGLNNVVSSYSPILDSLRARLLGLQIQPTRKRGQNDVDSEIECLLRVTTEIEKDQDSKLLGMLNEGERQLWTAVSGEPLSINWKPDDFANIPFDEEGRR